MDEQLILTGLPLRLNPSLHRSVPAKGVNVLSVAQSGGELLTLSDRQYEVLRAFLNPTSVPDVLRVLILRRAAIPLREFYELVIKAARAGVLITEVTPVPPPAPQWRWWRMPDNVFAVPTWAGVTVVVLWLVLYGLPLDLESSWVTQSVGWVVGWFAFLGARMLGDVLGAGVLTRLRGSAPRPRWHGLTFFPRFVVDFREVAMLNRSERVGLISARLLPPVALVLGIAGLAPTAWQSAGLIPVLGLLLELRPFGEGSLMPLVSSLLRGEVLDTHRKMAFSLNRRWWVRMHFGLTGVRPAYVFVRVVLAAAWSWLLVSLALRATGSSLREVYGDHEYWGQVWFWFSLYVLAVALVVLAPPTFRRSRRIFRDRFRKVDGRFRHWLVRVPEVSTQAAILKRMAGSTAFRRLSPHNRLALVAAGEVRRLSVWRTYGSPQAPVPLGLILSGQVAVYRSLGNRPWQRVAVYREGDVLGAESWADPDGGAVQIRTLVPVVILEWSAQVFGERVIGELGAASACDLLIKVPFLRQLPLCRGWHPQALARFAQLARFTTFEHGHAVLAEGEAVLWFFLLYSGGAATRRRSGTRARLGPGDFFGEISLMRQDVATADVLTEGVTRCLLVHRPEFLRFMTHNPIAALEVERVSTRRFGRPVFPYGK